MRVRDALVGRWLRVGSRLALAGALGASATLTSGADPRVEAELRRLTQELLDAVAPGRVEVWDRLLHESVVHVDENGVVRDKPALLRELHPLPAGLIGRIEVDRFQVVLHGGTAIVANEMQESLDYHGQSLRTRFRSVDTWLQTPRGWRLVAQHITAVLKDPPAVRWNRVGGAEAEQL